MAPKQPFGLYRHPESEFWYYDFRIGKKCHRGSTGESDPRAAAKVAAQKHIEFENKYKATIALGLAPDAADRTVEDATYYLAIECQVNADGDPIPDATRGFYMTKGGHLSRLLRECSGCEQCAIGNFIHPSIQLADLKQHHVVAYRDRRRATEDAADSTVKKELNVLASALRQAATDKNWCKPSLAVDVIPKLKVKAKPKTRWLTPDEFLALLAALDTSLSPQHLLPRLSKDDPDKAAQKAIEIRARIKDRQLFVSVACFTGAELAVLERLDWTDIDLVENTIRLRGTKTEARDRTIDLHPTLRMTLLQVPAKQRTGRVLRPWANACHDLHVACERAGFPGVPKPRPNDPDHVDYGVTPHTFRHTFASWLVQAGVPTFTVAKLMGHRDSKMVEDYYGHLAPKNRSEAMTKLPSLALLYPDTSHLITEPSKRLAGRGLWPNCGHTRGYQRC